MTNQTILAVPTNIITGFLGAGKTSAILHLLRQKPADERWAVLVNEFGEIGVDGSLLNGQVGSDKGVFIREVPGGCMCCASGVPMQIALNQLLKEAKPDRLLIEPTGLGHPIEVLAVLSNKYYQPILKLQKNITLVDARNLKDPRYTAHEVFNQQLQVADIIVGSKLDLYQPSDKAQLLNYLRAQAYKPDNIVFIEHGQLPLALLSGETEHSAQLNSHQHHQDNHQLSHQQNHQNASENLPKPLPEKGYIKAINKGQGFNSVGWHFSASKIFNRQKLHSFLSNLQVIRVKAVFITSEGTFGYNSVANHFEQVTLAQGNESRVEIICEDICENIEEQWHEQIMNAIIP